MGFPGTRVTVEYELPNVGAGNGSEVIKEEQDLFIQRLHL